MSTQATREYLLCIWKQYKSATKEQKVGLLNELERNLGLHRKAAIRLINRPWVPRSQQARPGTRASKYSAEAKTQLAILWPMMGFMCAERMKAALPEWLQYRHHKDCGEAIKSEILSMSASSVNRFLKGTRAAFQRKHNTGVKRQQKARTPGSGRTDRNRAKERADSVSTQVT
ncbi:MAG: hypothetical protein H7318_04650 [Oligoflexus sp.]|nr:hypothetical protein [Oligoflexus sp.]